MKTLCLFCGGDRDTPDHGLTCCDGRSGETETAIPSRAPATMRPRLSRQCLAILDRLRRGPVTNHELAKVALKYTGRLSEIRQAGYDVRVVEHDHASGLVTYRLVA